MSKAEPIIQKYMTTQPYSIEAGKSLSEAKELMSKSKIRHLPVMKGGTVVGMLSDRDLRLVSGFEQVDMSELSVNDVCSTKLYTVSPDTLLSEVCPEMAENLYGSAVVVQNGKLVGIFTTVDVCKALSAILAMRFHNS